MLFRECTRKLLPRLAVAQFSSFRSFRASRIFSIFQATPASFGNIGPQLAAAVAVVSLGVVAQCQERRPEPPPVSYGPPPKGGYCLPFFAVVDAGGHVYVSGQLAWDHGKDMAGQTRDVLAKLDAALASVGVDRSHVVKADGVVWDAEDMPLLAEVYGEWLAGVEVLPAISVQQAHLLCMHCKVEIAVRASRWPKAQHAAADSNSPLPGSAGVRSGGFAFVSGTVDPSAGRDASTQAKGALLKIEGALEAVGMSKSNIVMTHVSLTDLADLHAWNRTYGEWLGDMPVLPAMSCVQESALQQGAKIEISMIASEGPRSSGSEIGSCAVGKDTSTIAGAAPCSSVVRAGDFAYTVAMDLSAPDTEGQVRGVCQKIDAALASVGMHKGQIVEARGVLKDMSDLMMMNAIYDEWLRGVDVLPAKMVHSPAALCDGARFELSVVASTASKTGVRFVAP